MRICTLRIDGYGCFADRTFDLCPGLQIVVGPNEQGKSTLRSFISDMLYGQKRSPLSAELDASHELRRPWTRPDRYAGVLRYRLDDGREIDIERTFDESRPSLRVADVATGNDIGGQFDLLGNGERAFAEAHLGLAKDVFLNVATITPLTLDSLGNDEGLARIREKLLALTETSDGTATPDDALELLDTWLQAIGRGPTGNGRPPALSSALDRIVELTAERDRTVARREELAATETRLAEACAELTRLRSRQGFLQRQLSSTEDAALLRRVSEVERLTAERDELTQRCFSLSAYREFPLGNAPEVQRAANAAATARSQLERSDRERSELARQVEEERQRLGDAAHCELVEVPEDTETRLRELEETITRLHERLEDLEGDRIAAEALHAKAQQILAGLPDFSQMGPDPVEWINQFATSFRVQAEARDREHKSLARLSEQLQQLTEEVAAPERTFKPFENFPLAARDHEVEGRLYQEQWSALTTRIEKIQTAIADDTRAIPQCIVLTLTGFFFMAALGAMAYFVNAYLYVAAGLSGAMGIYHLAFWTFSRHSVKRGTTAIADTEKERAALEEQHKAQRDAMETAVREAGLESVRELEALYDRYVKTRDELDRVRAAREEQEARCAEETAQAEELLQKLRLTFTHLSVKVEGEEDVSAAASRAIARYQEYRDAKRRVADTRERPTRIRASYTQTKAQLDALEREEVALSLEVRNLMRKAGFRDEAKHTSALGALRAYRIRVAQLRERRGRIAALEERLNSVEDRIAEEGNDLEQQDAALSSMLTEAEATSFEDWQEQAEKARDYQEFWKQRTQLTERIDALLDGRDIESLRRAAADASPPRDCPAGDTAAIRAEMEQLGRDIETVTEQQRTLNVALAEQGAGLRALGEIDEELAQVRALAERLEQDIEAGSYAASLIEEAAREERSRLAPELARLAGEYLDTITQGAHTRVILEDGLSVRVPTGPHDAVAAPPGQSLSTGTLNQVYLALRLALCTRLSAAGESIPVLLDDPFAHYDDNRIDSALELLESLGRQEQVIVLTCRQDVASVAGRRGLPILTL